MAARVDSVLDNGLEKFHFQYVGPLRLAIGGRGVRALVQAPNPIFVAKSGVSQSGSRAVEISEASRETRGGGY